ncbi:MAG: hypothetical protein MAG451_01699 [Anaerolineales bacterium]|nr:hypothetical protein [Anaerolineales bacterium]
MEHMISAEIVTQTWQRMAQTPIPTIPQLIDEMRREQPFILSYLLALGDFPFNQHEREIIFYVGLVVWQIVTESDRRLGRVTRAGLGQAEEANYDFLDLLASDTEADFVSATETMLENHPEPEVLRYIVEAINDEEEYTSEDPPIREEYRGLAFVHLKIALDAFVKSFDTS